MIGPIIRSGSTKLSRSANKQQSRHTKRSAQKRALDRLLEVIRRCAQTRCEHTGDLSRVSRCSTTGLKSLRYAASVRMANRHARAAVGKTHADYGRGKCNA